MKPYLQLKEISFFYFLDSLVGKNKIIFDVGCNNGELSLCILDKYKNLDLRLCLFEPDISQLYSLGKIYKEYPSNILSINNVFVTDTDEVSSYFSIEEGETSNSISNDKISFKSNIIYYIKLFINRIKWVNNFIYN